MYIIDSHVTFSGFRGGPKPQNSPAIAPCNNEPYRSYDGTCNNLDNPDWGQAMTRYGRLIKPRYADGQYLYSKKKKKKSMRFSSAWV